MSKRQIVCLFATTITACMIASRVLAGPPASNRWRPATYNPAKTAVGGIPWTTSNLATLRKFDKAAIVRLFNESGGFDTWPGTGMDPSDLWEFKWMDLFGGNRVELVTIESSGPCCVSLGIFRQDAIGKISSIGFGEASTIKNSVRDLNGDGKYELILYKYLKSGFYQGTTPVAMWPEVYRWRDGNYVPAPRDFPHFYDDEVLPKLDREIKEDKTKWPTGSGPMAYTVEVLEMERDKILRVLGRDPTAGLDLAREWRTSSNPETVWRAAVVFADMGLEDEHRAALAAYKRALAQEPRGKE